MTPNRDAAWAASDVLATPGENWYVGRCSGPRSTCKKRRSGMLRSRVNAAGGHATLLRASEPVRRNVDVFHPQEGRLASLSERVRHSFDPKNLLNRGRLTRRPSA